MLTNEMVQTVFGVVRVKSLFVSFKEYAMFRCVQCREEWFIQCRPIFSNPIDRQSMQLFQMSEQLLFGKTLRPFVNPLRLGESTSLFRVGWRHDRQ